MTNRVDRHALASLEQARKTMAKRVPPLPDTTEKEAARKRQEDLARVAELVARGFFERPGEKPPD